MTLEDAQEKIIQLSEKDKENQTIINSLNESIIDYKKNIEDKDNEINTLKEHNMNLFLKVTQELDNTQNTNTNNLNTNNEPKESTSWEDFEFKC